MNYTIHRVSSLPTAPIPPQSNLWNKAAEADIDHFHVSSSDHRPVTRFRVLADNAAIHVRFFVKDRYVLSVQTGYMAPVCKDSCVEFFFQPNGEDSYFNFEFNAGGVLHASCVRDGRRTDHGFADWEPLTRQETDAIGIFSSLPRVIETEMTDPIEWFLSARIPLDVLKAHRNRAGLSTNPGTRWRGNFYKCADNTSHPHWASWSPIGENLNFHQPAYFSELIFSA